MKERCRLVACRAKYKKSGQKIVVLKSVCSAMAAKYRLRRQFAIGKGNAGCGELDCRACGSVFGKRFGSVAISSFTDNRIDLSAATVPMMVFMARRPIHSSEPNLREGTRKSLTVKLYLSKTVTCETGESKASASSVDVSMSD